MVTRFPIAGGQGVPWNVGLSVPAETVQGDALSFEVPRLPPPLPRA